MNDGVPQRTLSRLTVPRWGRLVEIRDNRIAEAEREGWFGGVAGLRVCLAGAEDKLVPMDRQTSGGTATDLGMPGMAPAQYTQVEGTASLSQSPDDQQ